MSTTGSSNSAESQRGRLLEHLKKHDGIDTVDARRNLDILCPASRIIELRRGGHNIVTVWVYRQTECGKMHRIAKYVLFGG